MAELAPTDRRATSRTAGRVWEREILRVAAALTTQDERDPTVAAREIALAWADKQVGSDLPDRARTFGEFEHFRGGRTCIAAVLKDSARDVWAIRVDRPDNKVAQRSWTTEIVVARAAPKKAVVSLRLLASSHESVLQIEPAVPQPIAQISRLGYFANGISWVSPDPWYIDFERDAEKLLTFLINPARTMPVIVLAIADGEDEHLLDPEALAAATVGLARVVVLRADCTWVFTKMLGKQRSVFAGGARVYLPGFTEGANPFAHRLFLGAALADDTGRRSIERALRWIVANESRTGLQLEEDVITFATVREQSLEANRESLRGTNADVQLEAAERQIAALKDDLRRTKTSEESAHKEWQEADERERAYRERALAAEFRIQQLIGQLQTKGVEPDADIEMPSSWDGFADWCDQALIGRLTLSARARRDLRDAIFEDPALAARCLLWLANAYRMARQEGGGSDLRVVLESGVHNDRCGTDSFDFDWEGEKCRVEWHIKNGGNTHDPRRCLRIYYFWHEATQQVVVATLPAHVRSEAS